VEALRRLADRLSPKQRQWATLAGIAGGGFLLLWLVLTLGARDPSTGPQPAASGGGTPTNVGVMAPGQQVNPVDQWVGTAGRKLSQYEAERDAQDRINRDRKAFEEKTLQRFAEFEQRLQSQAGARPQPEAPVAPPPPPPLPARPAAGYPPAAALPLPGAPVVAPGLPPPPAALPPPAPPQPTLVRVAVADGGRPSAGATGARTGGPEARPATVDAFLPVSFTRGILLGGLDAPTGGQSQSNPQPVLIRLSDNSVLPNRYRAEYRECFVIAAGYGDIGSERAYLRTESLSCVRGDGSTLEVRIQGSVFGEDGKVGMRGRLVTKQGQMLANALRAGIIAGIGQAFASYNTTVSTSALGTVATTTGADALRSGVGIGVGRALDRLAEYYIKLAEQTFPVIEVDAGREIDVVITKGVRIDAPVLADARPAAGAERALNDARSLKVVDDEER
jgi:conjugal transfer pilus assembly protein TraB